MSVSLSQVKHNTGFSSSVSTADVHGSMSMVHHRTKSEEMWHQSKRCLLRLMDQRVEVLVFDDL